MKQRAGLVFAALALAWVVALAVFPARAYLAQRQQRVELAAKAAELASQNQALQARTEQLHTDAEIERLARQYNLVKPGEEVYFVLPQAGVPPAGPPSASPVTKPAQKSPSLWGRFTSIF